MNNGNPENGTLKVQMFSREKRNPSFIHYEIEPLAYLLFKPFQIEGESNDERVIEQKRYPRERERERERGSDR